MLLRSLLACGFLHVDELHSADPLVLAEMTISRLLLRVGSENYHFKLRNADLEEAVIHSQCINIQHDTGFTRDAELLNSAMKILPRSRLAVRC